MVLQVKNTPKRIFFNLRKISRSTPWGLGNRNQNTNCRPQLESAFTVVSLASENILLLGELRRDSSEHFSRRKFFQFKMENILLESVVRRGLFFSTALFSQIRMTTEYPCDDGTALAKIELRRLAE